MVNIAGAAVGKSAGVGRSVLYELGKTQGSVVSVTIVHIAVGASHRQGFAWL